MTMPDEPEWARLRNELIRNTLADRKNNPVEDERLVAMQEEYYKTRKKMLRIKREREGYDAARDVFVGRDLSAMSGKAFLDVLGARNLEFGYGPSICPR